MAGMIDASSFLLKIEQVENIGGAQSGPVAVNVEN